MKPAPQAVSNVALRPAQLVQLLIALLGARMPVLITGKPGIGKSDIVALVAKLLGADLMISHPAVEDPTDYKGLPWPKGDDGVAAFLPFGQFARAINYTGKLLIWFLDDLGQASPAVQAAAMQLLLAREVNGHKLPDNVVFVAATNRRVDRANVTGILEPVKSRFATIVELEPDLDDWCQWAFGAGMPPEVIAFLRFRPNLLCDFQPTADLTNSPLPRTWAHAGRILKLGLPQDLEYKALAGAIGSGAAVELGGFLQLYKELPSIDAILLDPNTAPIPAKPATRYAVVTALAMRANVNTFGRIATYAERLEANGAGEFGALLVSDCLRKDNEVTQTPEFIKLASGPLGNLYSGGAR